MKLFVGRVTHVEVDGGVERGQRHQVGRAAGAGLGRRRGGAGERAQLADRPLRHDAEAAAVLGCEMQPVEALAAAKDRGWRARVGGIADGERSVSTVPAIR